MSLRHRCGRTWSQRDCRCKNHQYIEKLVGDGGGNSGSKEVQRQGAWLEAAVAARAVAAREEAAAREERPAGGEQQGSGAVVGASKGGGW
ncbi:hypothetical protein GW17_00045833 [Ensete ventricosum]|nr:hypothetical protein GW17_00045833 [Ensete ventricosum]